MLNRSKEENQLKAATPVLTKIGERSLNSPTWFVDTSVVNRKQAGSFEKKVYRQIVEKTPLITMHHRHHINDKFAPARTI